MRNVDLQIFGGRHAQTMIDLPSGETSRDMERLAKILASIDAEEVTAFYLHLCEGRAGNERMAGEWERFLELEALTPATVVIHGTSLGVDQLGDLRDGGAKVAWSPQSNLRLYGETTRSPRRSSWGLPVALGADWMPSGSQSVGFLERGFVASRSVGRITVRSASGSPAGYGTGFLISPRLLLTNNHMLEGAEVAAHSYVEFNYQSGADGTPLTPVLFGLAPEEFFVTSGALDFVKPGPGPDPAVLRSGLASLEANRNRPYYEEAADAKAARALHRNDRPRSRRRPCSPR